MNTPVKPKGEGGMWLACFQSLILGSFFLQYFLQDPGTLTLLKWQAAGVSMSCCQAGNATLSHAPEFYFLVESRETREVLGGKWEPRWQFVCLQQNVLNLTKLNRSLAYLLLSRWMCRSEVHVSFSLWKQAARPKLKKDKINDFTPPTFSYSLRGWLVLCVCVLIFCFCFCVHVKGQGIPSPLNLFPRPFNFRADNSRMVSCLDK